MKIHRDIFGETVPDHCEWTDINDIINVLNKIGKINNSNHTFFPGSGGLDLDSAELSNEPGCIELDLNGLIEIVKPEKLVYEKIEDNHEWSYFRLETLPFAGSGLYELPKDFYYEEVVELRPGKFISRSAWDAQEYNGEPLPKSARVVSRLIKGGALVIFKKMSYYNHNSATYDGRHETLGAAGFKQHIMDAFKAVGNKPLRRPEFE